MFHLKTRKRDQATRGQSVVEFALVLPILLLVLAAAIDLGRFSYAYVAVQNAAKEGAFYGARSPLCDDNANPACADPQQREVARGQRSIKPEGRQR